MVKNLPAKCKSLRSLRDSSSIPGCGRSPGERHGNPLQYSFVENLHESPWTEEPGELQSIGLQRVGDD